MDTVEVCAEYLELKGIKVLAIGYDGREAVSLYQKHSPDVVFLDVMMPNYDGIYGLEHIKKINPESQVIMATADKTQATRTALERLEANGIIYKPYDIDEMLDVVTKIKNGEKVYAPF